jgi:hypothetical protein
MTSSILTVVTPANTVDLTILATVKTELGITDTASDEKLDLYIDQASCIFAAECGRVFAKETVSEQFRFCNNRNCLILTRCPVASITSVTEDDVVLDQSTDYEVDAASGLLYRLQSDIRSRWCARKIVVVYVGGYTLLTELPQEIERAVISLVKQYHFGGTRDPQLRGEEVIGVQRFDYRVSSGADDGAYPPDFEKMVQKYRRWSVY